MSETAATISFHPEAFESAARAFQAISGYMVRAITASGESFDAYIGGGPTWDYPNQDPLRVNDENGQYEVLLSRCDEVGKLTGEAGYADIYDDLVTVLVY